MLLRARQTLEGYEWRNDSLKDMVARVSKVRRSVTRYCNGPSQTDSGLDEAYRRGKNRSGLKEFTDTSDVGCK